MTSFYRDNEALPELKVDNASDETGDFGAADINGANRRIGDVRAALYDWNTWTPQDLGCACDGSTDDRGTINSNFSTKNILLGKGTMRINSSVTISGFLEVKKGALIYLDTGVELTLAGGFHAGWYNVFTGPGRPIFAAGSVVDAKLDWCGTDAAAAHKLRDSGAKRVLLANKDYTESSAALDWNVAGVELVGVSPSYPGNTKGTRWITNSAAVPQLKLGFASDPGGGSSNFCAGLAVRGISFHRGVAPARSSDLSSAIPGILITYAYEPELDRVQSRDSIVGAKLKGAVRPYFRRCRFARTTAGSGSAGPDFFKGVYQDGSLVNSGFGAGNTAPIYEACIVDVEGALAAGGGSQIPSEGWYADEGYGGTQINACRTHGCQTPVHLYGLADNADATVRTVGNTGVVIRGLVGIGTSVAGILVEKQSEWGSVTVHGASFTPIASATGLAVNVKNSGGSVNLQGIVGSMSAGGTGRGGLKVETSSGVNSQGNAWVGAQAPVVLDTAKDCRIEDTIVNPTETATDAAVSVLGTCSNLRIAPIVKGGATKFAQGVKLAGTAVTDSTIDTAMIETATITSGTTNLVWYNGAAVVPGQAGNNILTGANLTQPVVGTITRFLSSGTFTTPSDSSPSTVYEYEMVGGGGGGGAADTSTTCSGAGGGAGAYARGTFTGQAPGTAITVTVGANGSAGAAGGGTAAANSGGAGGDTSIGAPVSVTAGGGAGGTGAIATVSTLGGLGGTITTGTPTIGLAGGRGGPGYPAISGGHGASSIFGGDGYGGGQNTGSGRGATQLGAGGGGAYANAGSSNGGGGAKGIVIIKRLTK